VFNKTIYVVPKPRILLVSPDADSPLYKVLRSLYETNTASSVDDANLTDYKAVVLDNINDGGLSGSSIGKLRDVKIDNNRGDYFLKVLADLTGGDFIQLELDQRLDLKFGQESPDLPTGDYEGYAIVRLDEEHFITRYLNISGSISGYNDVTQKVGARRLVTTSMGKPVVTVWEFGLGRVVTLSSDNGNMWAGALYSGENARLLPSTVNWAVGDPGPEDVIVVYSGDMNLGSPGTVIIRCNEMPSVVFGGEDVPVIQTGERTYEGVIEPDHIGLFNLEVSGGGVTLEDTAAVNYPLEYRDVGNDPDFLEAVKHSGGGVYNVDQVGSLLFSDIRKNSIMTSEEHVSLSWVFLIIALLVFLGDSITEFSGEETYLEGHSVHAPETQT